MKSLVSPRCPLHHPAFTELTYFAVTPPNCYLECAFIEINGEYEFIGLLGRIELPVVDSLFQSTLLFHHSSCDVSFAFVLATTLNL